ncbi:MAG: hypothetical protein AAGA50_09135 [Pseudomonadota bacterium]
MNESPSFPLPKPVKLSIDHQWKTLTRAANRAFEIENFELAEKLYDDALYEAEQRFRNDRAPGTMQSAPSMLIAAGANAAECSARCGDNSGAAKITFSVLHCLRTSVDDVNEVLAFRHACFLQLKPALLEFANRAKSAGISKCEFSKVAEETRKIALSFISNILTIH